MYYPVLLLSNGTELKGGEAGSTIKALTLHTAVNSGQEFTIGSAFRTTLKPRSGQTRAAACKLLPGMP